ncbi:MAG: ABC transporter permease subunit [Defluviitaleaceae bacterium]|nr:ABC transporter permease subunit [Defluviitaleaceae bacterium]MCL2835917.1 ABC transporter permease subunit [Defluviitaleaceae bacterium]
MGGLVPKPAELRLRDDLEKYYWRNVWRRMLKDWRLYLMILPLLLIFLFWRYFPLYELIAAFKLDDPTRTVLNRDFVGFQHFNSLMFGVDAAGFWQAFRNTFLLSFYGLLFGFPIPIIIALFFSEIRSNGYRSVLQVATYLPRFVSTVVITTLCQMLLSGGSSFAEPGILAQVFARLGMIPEDAAYTGMLYLPQYFRAIFNVSGIWETAGYSSIIYFAAIIGISPSSYEAARIDGASKMAQIRHVVLPSILSTITIMLILNIGTLLTIGYEKVLLLYNSYTYSTANVVSTYVFQRAGIQAGAATNQSLASAADMINAVTSMLLVIGANMISRRASDTSLY